MYENKQSAGKMSSPLSDNYVELTRVLQETAGFWARFGPESENEYLFLGQSEKANWRFGRSARGERGATLFAAEILSPIHNCLRLQGRFGFRRPDGSLLSVHHGGRSEFFSEGLRRRT